MLAPSWLQVIFLVFLLGAAFQMPWMVYFATAVGAVFALSEWWRRRSLEQVSYQRRLRFRRGFPDESLALSVTVENHKLLPLSWLRASDPGMQRDNKEPDLLSLPAVQSQEKGELTNLYSLRGHERIPREFTLRLNQRGVYVLGPATLESGDLFGLYRSEKESGGQDFVTVFPEMLPLEALRLPADDPFGERTAQRPLFEDPARSIGVRPYHPSDGFRRIHWPATARSGELQSRVYQPVTARVTAVCLNTATNPQPWLGYSPALLEYLVKAAATLIYHGIQNGFDVGLYSNACLAHADQPFRIPPGRTPAHLAALLEALAGVTPYIAAPFEKFLLRVQAEIPYGATLAVLSGQTDEALQDALLRLKRYRPRILLYHAGPKPPPELPGIRMVHLPFHEAADD